MTGYGANPIFFNKRIKIGHPEHLLTSPPPHLPTSDNISFLPYPTPTPLKVGLICVSLLMVTINVIPYNT